MLFPHRNMRPRPASNHSTRGASRSRASRARSGLNLARLAPLAACVLVLLLFAPQSLAQFSPPHAGQEERKHRPRRSEPQPQATASVEHEDDDEADDEEDEGESESQPRMESARTGVADPAAVMRAARVVYVNSKTAFVNAQEVEDSLRKRKEFRAWGLVVTRNMEEADLHIEITRKAFTRRFTFSVLDSRTMTVVASGKTRSVIFGRKIANKVAEKFVNRMKRVRPYPPVGP